MYKKWLGYSLTGWTDSTDPDGMNIILLTSVHLVIYSIYSNTPSSWCQFASIGAWHVWGDSTAWLIGVPAVGATALPEFLCGNTSNTACTIVGISSLVSDSVWWSEPTSLVPRPDLLLRLFPEEPSWWLHLEWQTVFFCKSSLCLNTALDFQHNTIRWVYTTLYRQSDTIWRVGTLLNCQYPTLWHMRKMCLMTPLSLSITSASLCLGEHLH